MGWMDGFANKLIPPSPLETPFFLLSPFLLRLLPQIRLSPASIPPPPRCRLHPRRRRTGPAPSEEAPDLIPSSRGVAVPSWLCRRCRAAAVRRGGEPEIRPPVLGLVSSLAGKLLRFRGFRRLFGQLAQQIQSGFLCFSR